MRIILGTDRSFAIDSGHPLNGFAEIQGLLPLAIDWSPSPIWNMPE
jgi:hypothetical protein